MKKFFQNKKRLLLAGDILLIPGLFLCELLSDFMLSQESVCQMVLIGGKCVTCGGTHFVNTLLNGRFGEAFQHNQFLFILTVYLAIGYLLLHLHWLARIPWVKKVLSAMYSIPSLILWCIGFLAFFLIRNIPVFVRIWEFFLG